MVRLIIAIISLGLLAACEEYQGARTNCWATAAPAGSGGRVQVSRAATTSFSQPAQADCDFVTVRQ